MEEGQERPMGGVRVMINVDALKPRTEPPTPPRKEPINNSPESTEQTIPTTEESLDAPPKKPLPTPPSKKVKEEEIPKEIIVDKDDEFIREGGSKRWKKEKTPKIPESTDNSKKNEHLNLQLQVISPEGKEGAENITFKSSADINVETLKKKLNVDPRHVLLWFDPINEKWILVNSDKDIMQVTSNSRFQVKRDWKESRKLITFKREVCEKFRSGELAAPTPKEHHFKIELIADMPVTPPEGGSPFTTYLISVTDEEGVRACFKRYREINNLHQLLERKFMGTNIKLPVMPPKRILGNLDPVFVQERKEGLTIYFKELTSIKKVVECSILKDFFNTSL